MSNAVLSDYARAPAGSHVKAVVGAVLALWLAAVFVLGGRGALVTPPGEPPLAILVSVLAPLLVFFAAFGASRAFREHITSLDLRVVAGIQAWRFGGIAFIALYIYNVLPGMFAWPAGLGDVAIGAVAPWIILSLVKHPGFTRSNAFRIWNWLGVLDLVVAVTMGALSSVLATGASGEVTTAPMAHLPLVLIPAYLVPILLMLHFTALYQTRRAA